MEATVGPVIDPSRHLPLAYKIAGNFMRQRPWLNRLDVEAEAIFGLMKAAWGFRPAKGNRFSTYATPIIWRRLASFNETEYRFAGRLEIGDVAADAGESELERQEERQLAEQIVSRLLQELPERERLAVEQTFLAGKTLAQVGAELGVTAVRARHLREAGFRRMAASRAARRIVA